MENVKYLFEGLEICKINNKLYVSEESVLKYLKYETNDYLLFIYDKFLYEKLIKEEDRLLINDEYYLDINFFILFLNNQKIDTKRLFNFLLENNLINFVFNYLVDYNNFVHDPRGLNFYDSLKNYEEIFKIVNKFGSLDEGQSLSYDDYPNISEILDVLEKTKDLYFKDKEFGRVKDYNSFIDFFDNKLDDLDDKTVESLATYNFYRIINEKPFYGDNVYEAIILTIYYLFSNKSLFSNYKINLSPEDIVFMTWIVTNDSKDVALTKIKNILKNRCANCDTFNNEVTRDEESKFNYVLNQIENKEWYAGYYEYFASENNDCLKLMYNIKYINLKLNQYKTLISETNLVFSGVGKVYIEAPKALGYRSNFIDNRLKEIKERSVLDVKNNIKNQFKDFFENLNKDIGFDLVYDIEFVNEY